MRTPGPKPRRGAASPTLSARLGRWARVEAHASGAIVAVFEDDSVMLGRFGASAAACLQDLRKGLPLSTLTPGGQNGDKEILYYRDFASGAMIENVVRRAKKLAIKREIAHQEGGIRTDDLLESIRQEYKENEDLPNTTNPDDWARISGKKGERIVYVRTLLTEDRETRGGRSIERVGTGQYL